MFGGPMREGPMGNRPMGGPMMDRPHHHHMGRPPRSGCGCGPGCLFTFIFFFGIFSMICGIGIHSLSMLLGMIR